MSLVLLGQDGNRCAIVQQILQAFGGMGRVQRHVAGLGLEDRQQPRQGVETTPGQDCDSPTRSWSSQMSCWAPVRGKRAGWLEEYCIRSFSWGSGTGRAEVAHYTDVAGFEHGRRGVSDTRNPDIQMDG